MLTHNPRLIVPFLPFVTAFSATVHIGMCHPPPAGNYNKCPAPSSSSSTSSTSSHPHPHPHIMPRCDCPNCDAPGSHKFEFCTNGTSDDSSSSSSSSNSASSSSSTTRTSYYGGNGASSNNNNNGNTYANGGENTRDTSQTNRSKQSATSMFFNPMAYILAGSAAVLLVGAVLIRKRVRLLLWRGGKSRTELILLTVKSTGTIATG
jgi:cobalamin biosynthesis Mg chelatase CobN